MIMDLPKQGFEFVKNRYVDAYINEEKILKIKKEYVDFEDLMYTLTYVMKRDMVCPYCGEPIKARNLTLDHMYPRDYGGVSITNNLIPCCKKCNSQKGNLDVAEYHHLLAKDLSVSELEKEKQKIIMIKEQKRSTKGIFLPNEWIQYLQPKDLFVRDYYKNLNLFGSGTKTRRMIANMEYIRKYNSQKRPVVVDRNGYIVDGYTWYAAVLEMKKTKKVAVIMIENMELF